MSQEAYVHHRELRWHWGLVAAGVVFASVLQVHDADAACIPGFDYAAFGKDNVKIGGNSATDGFNSAVGSYDSTKTTTSGGNLGTNGEVCAVIDTNGASTIIGGNVEYGPDGSPCSVSQGPATIHGTQTPLSSPVNLPSVIIPATIGTPQGAVNAPATLSATPNNTYATVNVGNNNTLTMGGGTYIFDNMTVKGEVKVTGAVVIYFKCDLNTEAITMNAGGLLNKSDPQKPTNLIMFLGPKCKTAKLTGGTNASFAVYGPDTNITIQGGSDVYGAIVGKSVTASGGVDIHYDRALSSFATGEYTCAATEISRASPVVATINGSTSVVQGTFEAPTGMPTAITTPASISTWTFPYLKGHMRARVASTITTSASSFSSGTIQFDAGASGKIPTVNNSGCTSLNGTCRRVFTVTSTPDATGIQTRPTPVELKDSNANAIGALIAPASAVPGITATDWQTIVRKVLAAPLGGVDRSTVAVIEASPLVTGANGSRPTIAYFGGTDGMLHAVCASTGGSTATQSNVCPSLGTELWAFIPRTQLPLIRDNTARVDGSVRVVDAFGDFNSPPTGTKSWRTVLVFQTGFGAAAYALDVSDPTSPVILWEATTPSVRGPTELGTGLTVGAGQARINNRPVNLAVLQTTNGGTGGEGMVAKALSLETGAVQWSFGYVYPNPARGIADDLLPVNGIPGGAVPVDLEGRGFITDWVMGDLYGNFWRLNTETGVSRNGASSPLFSFSTNKKPIGSAPAIYSTGTAQYAAFGSGGYTHPTLTGWAQGTQYLLALKLDYTGATIDETGAACASCTMRVKVALSSGHKAFSQALVVGTSLVLATDVTEVNGSAYGTATGNTGELTAVDLTGLASPTVIGISAGATALANSGTTLYSSSSSKQQQMTVSGTTGGNKVDLTAAAGKAMRELWLRTE
jgi:hypothetical protein